MTHGYEWFIEYDFVDLDIEEGAYDYEDDVSSFENELDDYMNMFG